jgi:hypothetical protein
MKQKNRLIALVLSLFFGFFGIDRFYLGKKKSGIFKLITLGGLGFWWCFDCALLLAFLYSLGKDTGFVKDSNEQNLKYGLSMFRFKNGSLVRDWN